MTYHEKAKKLAEIATDNCPIEALMQFFFEDQYEYYNDLSISELEEEFNNLKEPDADFR